MNILIIKLGALGDVLRTTPLLRAYKTRYPNSRITWIVDSSCCEALQNNPMIDELLLYSPELALILRDRSFDLVLNLDKEDEAIQCMRQVSGKSKLGFTADADGKLCPADEKSDYAYRLGIDDELKFKLNTKTYQEISFEQAGFRFKQEEYVFSVPGSSFKRASQILSNLGVDPEFSNKPLIGLNTGAGTRFAGKKLPVSTLVRLAEILIRAHQADVILLGGKDELERNKEIQASVSSKVYNAGAHSLHDFAALVKRCDAVLSADSTAMHIAIAVATPVVCYFGSTCSQEIELYGRGSKIVTTVSCAPCYKKICPYQEECMSSLTPESFAEELKRWLPRKSAVT